ncbi:MAG: hypothetical protein WBF73_10460 [Bradyrhizobium sp.]
MCGGLIYSFTRGQIGGIISPIPVLTRRRDQDRRDECWLIYFGDIYVGTLAIRSGIPHDQAPWGWRCGFYPGSEPGECTSGTGTTFE